MSLMLGKLHDALVGAGATPAQAREAAEEVAGYDRRIGGVERDTTIVKWMVSVVVALLLGVFWMQWQIVGRLASIEEHLKSVDARLTAVEQRLTTVDERLETIEGRLGAIESRLPRP